jgi:hypothetical protein
MKASACSAQRAPRPAQAGQDQEQEYPERGRVFACLRLPYWVMPGDRTAVFSLPGH